MTDSPTFPNENNNKDLNREFTLSFNPLWCLILIPILMIPIGYVMYHDAGVDVENHMKQYSTCDSMKNIIELEGKKIAPNSLVDSVKTAYKEKCT